MMNHLQSVSVTYHGRKVGTLFAAGRQNCQFEYDKDWLADGFSISPLKLPLKSGIITADYQPFNGNFGVFEVGERKAHVARNPKKPGIEVKVPAHGVVRFHAGKEMRAATRSTEK